MFKAIVFDADGTLLDSMQIWNEVTPRYLMERGRKISRDFERRLFSMSIEQGAQMIRDEYGISETACEIKNTILKMVEDFYRNDVRLKDGAFDFILKMHEQNVPMCVATAGSTVLLEAAFERLKILPFLNEIFTCGMLNTDKSKPCVFNFAAEKLGAKNSETLVFEDALIPVKTAKNAGFKVVAVQDAFSFQDRNEIMRAADVFIKDFYDSSLARFLDF